MAKELPMRTLNEVRVQAENAFQNHRCLTVSAKWLVGLLNGVEALAKLAAKAPEFYNPLAAAEAEAFRDYVLCQLAERKSTQEDYGC